MEIPKSDNLSDKELLKACLSSDERAWQLFKKRFERLIASTIAKTASSYGIRLSGEEIEDCEQSLWTSLVGDNYRKLRTYKGINGCSLATWLKTCAVRAAINYIKSSAPRPPIVSINEDSRVCTKDVEAGLIEKLHYQRKLQDLKELCRKWFSKRERMFMELYFVDGIAIDEIAIVMKLSRSTLYVMKHRITRKIKRLRHKFDDL